MTKAETKSVALTPQKERMVLDRGKPPDDADCQRGIIQLITFPEFTALGYLVIPETT